MKRFFNFPTTLMLVFILAAIVAAVLSNPINWTGIIWMFIAGMWVANARSFQMTAESWKDLYEAQSKAFKSAKDAWTAAVIERDETDAKYQVLDNEYQKLAKEHEALLKQQTTKKTTGKKAKIQDIKETLAAVSPKKEEQPEAQPAQKQTRWKRGKYSDLDKSRIQEEMKSVGMEAKKDEE